MRLRPGRRASVDRYCLLAANKKAEQIDAPLQRTETHIDRTFPDQNPGH